MNIYVGNLPFGTKEEDLRQAFEPFGAVSSVNVVKDRYSGESRGFAFIEMPSDDEGRAAMQGLDGKEFQGRTLKVNEAKPRTDRPDRGGRPRGRGDR